MGRNILISLGVMIVAVAASVGVCRAVGCNPHVADLGLAAGICLLASIAALTPISLAGGASLAGMFQAALVGSVLHLAASLGLAIAAMLCLRRGNVFVYWMLGFYWLTLMEIVTVFVARMRAKEPRANMSV